MVDKEWSLMNRTKKKTRIQSGNTKFVDLDRFEIAHNQPKIYSIYQNHNMKSRETTTKKNDTKLDLQILLLAWWWAVLPNPNTDPEPDPKHSEEFKISKFVNQVNCPIVTHCFKNYEIKNVNANNYF